MIVVVLKCCCLFGLDVIDIHLDRKGLVVIDSWVEGFFQLGMVLPLNLKAGDVFWILHINLRETPDI